MSAYVIDDGKLPSSIIPLYVSIRDAEDEKDESLNSIEIVWQTGNASKAKAARKQILNAAKKHEISLLKFCDSIPLRWTNLREWATPNLATQDAPVGDEFAMKIFLTKEKKGYVNHMWFDEFMESCDTFKRLLEIPKDVSFSA